MRSVVVSALTMIVSIACLPAWARAVILYKTGTRNTASPTGAYANSGWQYQGQWSGFLGTPIAKQYFITAGHFGGAVGDQFKYQGVSRPAISMWDDPGSDLRIYKVKGGMPSWSPLYTGSNEVGQTVTVFGRGTQRGRGVFVNGVNKGWKWGAEDGVQSWGTNAVSGIANGGSTQGEFLTLNFDAKGTAFEGALSRGDSGGGVFINNGGKWQLAGINFSADGPFAFTTNGTTFDASVFDRGGLWAQSTGFVQDKSKNLPGASYATRISDRLDWINEVLNGSISPTPGPRGGGGRGVPEPSSAVVVALASLWICGRKTRTTAKARRSAKNGREGSNK
jgi:hypothetical protein